MSFKRGDVRSDGMVFWRYIRHRNNAEAWVSREQFAKYLDKNKASVLAFRKNNPEADKESHRKWYSRNREHCVAKNREWRERNKERHLANAKRWIGENREKHRDYVRKWDATHPDKKAAIRSLRRSRQKAATPALDNQQEGIISCLYQTSKRVSDKTGIPHEVDHIIPISKGGLHHPCNLQIIPQSVNRRKWAKVYFAQKDCDF